MTRPGKTGNQQHFPWRAIPVILGGSLLHFCGGYVYTIGNMLPYVTSYMRQTGSSRDLTYATSIWIYALMSMGQGSCMWLGGVMAATLRPRWAALIGSWLSSLGLLLTYFTIRESFLLTILTAGFMYGAGLGMTYTIPLGCAMKWLPNRKGLVNGCIMANFGAGTLVFVQMQTLYINPGNLKPNLRVDGETYFDEADLIERIPNIFLIAGGLCAALQFVGSMLLCDPPVESATQTFTPEATDRTPLLVKSENRTKISVVNADSEKPGNETKLLLVTSGSQESESETQISLVAVESSSTSDQEDEDLTPCQALKSPFFYHLFAMFLLNGQVLTFLSTLYKAYGQTFIDDDKFLALVGSLSAIFNSVCRTLWGKFADTYSFRLASVLMNTLLVIILLTMRVTELAGRTLFLVYVCLSFGASAGGMPLFPTATASCFGKRHSTIIYGLGCSSTVLTAPLRIYLIQLLASFGWTSQFYCLAAFAFCNLLLSFTFAAKDKNGNEI